MSRSYEFAFVVEQVLGHITHGDNLRQHVERNGVRPHWVLPGYEVEGVAAKIPVYNSNWTVRSGVTARRELRAIDKAQRLDAIFFHTQTTALMAADWVRRRPSVVSVDATPSQYDELGPFYEHDVGPAAIEKAKAAGMRAVLDSADHVVAWSRWAKDSLVADYGVPSSKVSVVPPGVSVDSFAVDRPEPGDGPVKVLFVGGDLERKGGNLLIEACRRLGPAVELHVVTRDDADPGPGLFVHRGLTPNSPELLALYRDCEVFALPTYGDCLPMVLSEAGAASMATVSTDVAGIPEIVVDGETGSVVPVGDVDALEAALRRLVDDPDLRSRLGRAAHRHVSAQYDTAANTDRLVEIMKAVADGHRIDGDAVDGSGIDETPSPAAASGAAARSSSPERPTADAARRDSVELEPASVGVGIVGGGFVADYYASTIPGHPELRLVGVADSVDAHRDRYAGHHGIRAFASVDELLSSDDIDIVVNLTNPRSHVEISEAALRAGKHVYTEKPLALDVDEARRLVELSEELGLEISSAPCSLLGETAQTIWKALRRGVVGDVRLVYAEMDEGLVHRMPFSGWSSEAGAPWPYRDEFELGTVIEHAGYVVTWLPAMFGSAVSVSGIADCLISDKAGVATDGTDFSIGIIRFESGVVARVTCSLIASHDHSLRIFGDDGELRTEDTWFYGSKVQRRRSVNLLNRRHQWLPWRTVKHVGVPAEYDYRGTQQMDFARGVSDLARSITAGVRPRLSGRYCLHTTEIVLALDRALRTTTHYEMTSDAPPVDPMPWALDA
ncbi:MAG: Gfo/Idh/MocA family oxidoreductase [Actinomycetota bacterium]